MTTIILYGDEKEKRLGKILFNTLSNIGNINYFNTKEIICNNKKLTKKNFVLYEISDLENLDCKNCIFIFKNSFKIFNENLIKKNVVPIFATPNSCAANILSSANQPAITCGTSVKNTLSIAGTTGENIAISLQRYIKNLNGQTIEPQDFTIKLSKEIPLPFLLITGAVLLLTQENHITEYNI